MAPNATTVDEHTTNTTPAIADYFWACDRRGMDQLSEYVRSCYDTLDNVQTLYKGRAELEQEFGQKLMALHKKFASTETVNEKSATQCVVSILYQEVEKSAQSHIDMSGRLQNEVAPQLDTWVKDRRASLDQLVRSLDSLYKERQEKVSMLLRIQNYQKRHDEYKSAVTIVNQFVDEWNTTWRNACEQIESLEQERIEFLFSSVWEYANLASARLLVQDEWCEAVRTQLEECNLHDDIVYCVKQYGTGTEVPTTSEYVDFFASKIVDKELPPRPRTMSNTPAPIHRLSLDQGHKSSTATGSMTVKRKPLGNNKDATLNALLKKFEEPLATPKQTEQYHHQHPPVPSLDGRPEISKKPHHNIPPSSIKPPKSPKPPPLQLSHDMSALSIQQHPIRTPSVPKTNTVPRSPNLQHTPSHYNHHQQQHHQHQQEQPPRSPALSAGDMSYRGQYQQPLRSPAMATADQAPRSPVVQHNLPVMSATADMAPRSPIQQHYPSWAPAMQTTPVDTVYQQQQQRQQHMYQPVAQHNTPVSADYAPRSPIQGYAAAPPRSPVTPHHSMGGYDVTQQRSPVVQQTSVSMAPRSPVMHHQAPMTTADMYPRSPTVPAAGYPDYNNSQQRWLPQQQQQQQQQPTYITTPASHWSGSSPPYDLPDGRRVQFWARAVYDRTAEDETEITFQKGNLFAVMGESEDSGWWNAELWDETWHCSQGAGCIPSNFMCIV